MHRYAQLFATLLLIPLGGIQAQVWEVDGQLLELPVLETSAQFGAALAIGDFNGDHLPDIVVGAPKQDAGDMPDTGGYRVWFGAPGRTLVPDYWGGIAWNQLLLAASALATGDFDGDGLDEIAIGLPGANIEAGGTRPGAGAVTIAGWGEWGWVYEQDISQLDTTAFSIPEANDGFGSTLAAGDFNGDSYDDLAVGVPNEAWSAEPAVGVVQVFYGSSGGLRTDNVENFLSADRTANEQFGYALAVGNFAGTYDGLAVGAPFRTVGGVASAGAVEVYPGSEEGLKLYPKIVLTDNWSGGTSELDDCFGYALAAGNFDRRSFCPTTCYGDLAIGVPGQDATGAAQAGKVVVAYSDYNDFGTLSPTELTQQILGGTPEAFDRFGAQLAAGHLEADFATLLLSNDGLAIRARGEESVPGVVDDGVIYLVYGSSLGAFGEPRAQLLPQKAGFAIAPPASFDGWGSAMAIADLDGDGWGDLVVGAPQKDLAGVVNTGAVQVLYGALFADGFESGTTDEW